MAEATDPVCGMIIDIESAAGRTLYEGTTFYFCSEACKEQFDANPTRYASTRSADRPEHEERETPWTKLHGWVAPMFGSAGSGGLEYEPLPEKHDKDDGHDKDDSAR